MEKPSSKSPKSDVPEAPPPTRSKDPYAGLQPLEGEAPAEKTPAPDLTASTEHLKPPPEPWPQSQDLVRDRD